MTTENQIETSATLPPARAPQIESATDIAELKTAVELAIEETKQSGSPDSDQLLSEINRTDGATKKDFPEPATRRVDIENEPALIDTINMPEFTSLEWANLRDQAPAEFHAEWPADPSRSGWERFHVDDTPELIEQLRAAQKKIEVTIALMEPYSTSNVMNRLHAARDKQAARIAAGEDVQELLPTRETISKDSNEKLAAFNALLVKITHEEIVPGAKIILERFEAKVAEFLRRTEIRDREECRLIGVAYEASIKWRAAAMIAMKYTARTRIPRPNQWSTPKQILDAITDL